jgi:hypothetical protein
MKEKGKLYYWEKSPFIYIHKRVVFVLFLFLSARSSNIYFLINKRNSSSPSQMEKQAGEER